MVKNGVALRLVSLEPASERNGHTADQPAATGSEAAPGAANGAAAITLKSNGQHCAPPAGSAAADGASGIEGDLEAALRDCVAALAQITITYLEDGTLNVEPAGDPLVRLAFLWLDGDLGDAAFASHARATGERVLRQHFAVHGRPEQADGAIWIVEAAIAITERTVTGERAFRLAAAN